MFKSFPPDVIVLDTDTLLHARMERSKGKLRVFNAKQYRLPEGTFASSVVTPSLTNGDALAETVRRVRTESGKLSACALLLPDSWFRINILDVGELPANPAEAKDVVRWALKRTLPIRPEELRLAHREIAGESKEKRVLAIAAVEATLASIESIFQAERIDVPVIESMGLNLWNAVAARESSSAGDRILLHVRDREFTTAVFRGDTPLFVRSRNLSGDRSLDQELRLSASYLKSSLQTENFAQCYVAGNSISRSIVERIGREFDAPVRQIELSQFAEHSFEASRIESELVACAGVYAA